jgi:hypothetical protein
MNKKVKAHKFQMPEIINNTTSMNKEMQIIFLPGLKMYRPLKLPSPM